MAKRILVTQDKQKMRGRRQHQRRRTKEVWSLSEDTLHMKLLSIARSVQLDGSHQSQFLLWTRRNDVEKKSKSGRRPLVISRSAAN